MMSPLALMNSGVIGGERPFLSIIVTSIRLGVGAVILAVITLLVADVLLADITPAGYFSLGYAALIGGGIYLISWRGGKVGQNGRFAQRHK